MSNPPEAVDRIAKLVDEAYEYAVQLPTSKTTRELCWRLDEAINCIDRLRDLRDGE